jgi:hypothetical protein
MDHDHAEAIVDVLEGIRRSVERLAAAYEKLLAVNSEGVALQRRHLELAEEHAKREAAVYAEYDAQPKED